MDKYFPARAITDCRRGLSITEDDRICIAVSLIPIDHPAAAWDGKPLSKYFHEPAYWANYQPKSLEIGWLESLDGGNTFTAKQVLPLDPERAHLQISLEMPTGFNHIECGRRPSLVYHTVAKACASQDTVGDMEDRLLNANVYFVDFESE